MITLFLKNISESLQKYNPYRSLIRLFGERKFPVNVEGPKGLLRALTLERLHRLKKGTSLVVVPTERDIQTLLKDLSHITDDYSYFPWWGTLPFQKNELHQSIVSSRVRNLYSMLTGEGGIVLTTLRNLLTPVPPPDALSKHIWKIERGKPINLEECKSILSKYGYERVPKVSVPGEFAIRGEVIDLFLPGNEEAIRVLFDFDVVEDIRYFDPFTQKSTASLDVLPVYPTREILWDNERIESLRIIGVPERIIEVIETRRTVADEEIFYPLSFPLNHTILEYLDDEAVLYLFDSSRLHAGYESLKKETEELFLRAGGRGEGYPEVPKVLFDFDTLLRAVRRKVFFPEIRSSEFSENTVYIPCDGPRSFFGNIQFAKEEIKTLLENGYSIHVFAESPTQADKISYLFKDFDLTVLPEGISAGFTIPDLKITAIQENEIFGRRKRVTQSVRKSKTETIDTFVDLGVDDYVVHVNYGIGRFRGIERIKAAGTERDYIKLEYASEENIFIPIEQVNLIQKYIGGAGESPRLDTIGGKAWENRKNKVRKAVEDLADRLIHLYSRREKAKGFSFGEDSQWQLEFEAAFPYEETEDQLRCIEEIKQDMESPKPMDRLICGDVGYGKTEVAMRAAFKAIMAGKQVAFLAPTTILAEQHFDTFKERFEHYPVNITMLSRFVNKSKQRTLTKEIARGDIDLIIGTHRILQRDVSFKNLGLFIIDEEQRFGVKDKERLKEIKTTIDCLTLSATPIPRTLHMSLLKIRDMSLLTTPPRNRLPIETHIMAFQEEKIAEAIKRESDRGGQVFYLHNRVETLRQVRSFLEKLVPEVMVECAHGQMSPHQLEDIMYRFVHGSFQVLVSTTIIENGIDIPNVNTIIIDRADMYGLSQLYQLRGRVGRSDVPAYAFLLYPTERALNELAMKRLQVLSEYTDLGSGFKIALKDLEVRGAGNLLGRQQSGEIAAVGFDMYIKLLGQAIEDITETEGKEDIEVYLELDYSGYIPDSYISEQEEKMEVYKTIASVTTEEDLEQVISEIEDRFGPPPEEVQSLLSLSEIRILCKNLQISSLKERKGQVEVEFSKVSLISADKVVRLMKDSGGKVKMNQEKPNSILMQTDLVGLKEKTEFLREKLLYLL